LVVTQQVDSVQVRFGGASETNGAPKVIEDQARAGSIDVQTVVGLEFFVGLGNEGDLVRIVSALPSDKHLVAACVSQWITDGLKVERASVADLSKLVRNVIRSEKTQRETVMNVPASDLEPSADTSAKPQGADAPETDSQSSELLKTPVEDPEPLAA